MPRKLFHLIRLSLTLMAIWGSDGFSREGDFYLGFRAGATGLSGAASLVENDSIGYGVDLGVRLSDVVDLYYISHFSEHSGKKTLALYSHSLSVEFHPLELDTLDVTMGFGPAFYFVSEEDDIEIRKEKRLGFNLGASASLLVSERINLGVASRYHIIGSGLLGGQYWTYMARVGYFF